MGAEFHIEVDELKMFHGYDWWPFGDEYVGDCPHNAQSVVAWGPTVAQYELVECDAGCGCRAWIDGRWQQARDRGEPSGFWAQRVRWYHRAVEG